jgi:hypothetical protein
MGDEMKSLIHEWHDRREAGCCEDEGPFCAESKAWAQGYLAALADVEAAQPTKTYLRRSSKRPL